MLKTRSQLNISTSVVGFVSTTEPTSATMEIYVEKQWESLAMHTKTSVKPLATRLLIGPLRAHNSLTRFGDNDDPDITPNPSPIIQY